MIWNHFSIFPSYLNNEIHNTGLEFLADKLSSGDAPLNIHAFKIIFNIPNSLISQSFNHSFYTFKIHVEVCLTPRSKFSDNSVSGFVSALITFSKYVNDFWFRLYPSPRPSFCCKFLIVQFDLSLVRVHPSPQKDSWLKNLSSDKGSISLWSLKNYPCSGLCSRKRLTHYLWSVMLWLTLNYVLEHVRCFMKISTIAPKTRLFIKKLPFFIQKHHFWMYKILFSNKKLWTESKNVFWSLDKLDGHLMTFWWWSATTWWSRFWCFWSWFWITIWFGNAAIWLVRTSIIRLTTWSTTWSFLTSLFIFKSWFVALNLKILEFKYHTMTHNWWLIRMNYIWLTYLGGGVLDFFGCENS